VYKRQVKFRVDRITNLTDTELVFHKKPKDYSISKFCKQVFSMYDGEECTVTLRCENSVMKDVVDRFGEGVKTTPLDDYSFLADVEVSVSQTFFAWVFAYAGKIIITSPAEIVQDYKIMLNTVLKKQNQMKW